MAKQDNITASLSEAEEAEIERRAAIRAVVVHEAIRKEGEAELSRSSAGLAGSGLAAGLSMGFSLVGVGQTSLGTYLVSYMVPTLLGNILGGVSIAAALNHAQVVASET